MPPKRSRAAEVRHNNVVSRILAKLELHWAQSRDRPGDWWTLREARHIVRNDPQTYTDDELNRATVDAYERFYQNHPFDFAIEIVLGVVESALSLVTGSDHGKVAMDTIFGPHYPTTR